MVVCVSRYLWTLRSVSRISAGIVFTFSDCNVILGSFGVYPTLGGGEKTFDSLGLLEAVTKIPTIKRTLTNNSAKHNLAFLEERSPDERITTNRVPINVECNNQLIKRRLICQYILTTNRSIHKNLFAPLVASRTRSLENIRICLCHV